MNKKQLNFSAPLMSARRYLSPLRSSGEDNRRDFPLEDRKKIPSKPIITKVDDVVKPGSVPFMWEQIPGKAKDGNVSSPEELPSLPKVPLGKISGELNGFRTPNKLSGELNLLRPQLKLSGEFNTLRSNNILSGELNSLNKYSSLNEVMVRWGNEGTEMNANYHHESENNDNDDDDDDVTFSDAIGQLSQRGSFSVSVSGLSNSETKPCKPSSMDVKARDFMMNRFLPAAKAMTLEPIQHGSKKQTVVVEQPKDLKALSRARTPPRENLLIVPYTSQATECEESDEEDGSFDDRSAISVKIKACGFLPWFCSKNSLHLLNPLPSMKNRSKALSNKLTHFVKNASLKSPSRTFSKDASFSSHKHKANQAFKSCELQVPKYTSRPMFYSGELPTRTGSPYRSSRSGSPSRYQSESPTSCYHKGVGFIALPKRINPYDDTRSRNTQKEASRHQESHRSTRISTTRSPMVEKTLYMDSVNISKVSHSILNLSKNKRHLDANKTGSVPHVAKSDSLKGQTRLQIMKARGLSGPLYGGYEADIPSYSSVSGLVEKYVVQKSNVSEPAESPLTPPLPKSPSESWLSNKLTAISPRSSVTYSSINSQLQSRNQNSSEKWENIVRRSHLRHDLGRYSEELVTNVPQRPRAWK